MSRQKGMSWSCHSLDVFCWVGELVSLSVCVTWKATEVQSGVKIKSLLHATCSLNLCPHFVHGQQSNCSFQIFCVALQVFQLSRSRAAVLSPMRVTFCHQVVIDGAIISCMVLNNQKRILKFYWPLLQVARIGQNKTQEKTIINFCRTSYSFCLPQLFQGISLFQMSVNSLCSKQLVLCESCTSQKMLVYESHKHNTKCDAFWAAS